MAPIEPPATVVCDAGPLIHLDELASLDLLAGFGKGTIGLLVRAIRRGLRSRDVILSLLREIPGRSTLHIRASLLQSVIEDVEKSIES